MQDNSTNYLAMLMAEEEGYSLGLPDGVFFLQEGDETLRVGEELAQVVANKGYRRVWPPLFEFYETYTKGGSVDIARRSFAFKDKDGALLALRYDMTAPIARMVSQRYEQKDLPLRLYYYGDVFREQPFHQGKPRQMRQLGIEVVGGERREIDAEILSVLGELLQRLDPHYCLVVGDSRMYQGCLASLQLSDMEREAIHRCFHLKDRPSLGEILKGVCGEEQAKKALVRLMDMVGGIEDIRRREDDLLSLGEYAGMVWQEILELGNALSSEERRHLLIDFGMVKDFGYYSSLMVEGYVSQSGYAVCHGGRYDGLYAAFGKNFPAVGFALDLSYTFR
ncbi:MAG: ATP phosphoribosyltransferase regulatory subunit [Brevinematales bacterium]|nr:ATP phosphoribosyltransferase regulatory subunit [Brevinematales bacterium]